MGFGCILNFSILLLPPQNPHFQFKLATPFECPHGEIKPQSSIFIPILYRRRGFICRAVKEYKFPDPIPEFADAETEKFRTHLAGKVPKKDVFGDSVDEAIEICTKIHVEDAQLLLHPCGSTTATPMQNQKRFQGQSGHFSSVRLLNQNEFLHTEYGGPGTLLVLPFIGMADALNDRGLPGGPLAARVAVKWAEKHVDKDWNQWTSMCSSFPQVRE